MPVFFTPNRSLNIFHNRNRFNWIFNHDVISINKIISNDASKSVFQLLLLEPFVLLLTYFPKRLQKIPATVTRRQLKKCHLSRLPQVPRPPQRVESWLKSLMDQLWWRRWRLRLLVRLLRPKLHSIQRSRLQTTHQTTTHQTTTQTPHQTTTHQTPTQKMFNKLKINTSKSAWRYWQSCFSLVLVYLKHSRKDTIH